MKKKSFLSNSSHGELQTSCIEFILSNFFDYDQKLSPKSYVAQGRELTIEIDPPKKLDITIRLTFKDGILADEVYDYRTRVLRFLTTYMQAPVEIPQTFYYLNDKRYALKPHDNDTQYLDRGNANHIIYGNTGFINDFLNYVFNFKVLGNTAHLYAAYIEFFHRDVYYESIIFNLLACVDSIASKIKIRNEVSKTHKKRSDEYDKFIGEITGLKKSGGIRSIKSGLFAHLRDERSKENYVEKSDFKMKLHLLFDYVDSDRLDDKIASALNSLRNDIAHGNDYDFDRYANGYTDSQGVEYPPVTGDDIKKIADVCWHAIFKFSHKEAAKV
ncbi:MAG TPA: hypothetical protein PLZ58_03675 [Candidatus Saccharibacteria bacterium]|nr:hypothetical protein [Candidatus Saccharibacteria bacterium]HRQ06826.1 hypothetical protein [Candidatus Saccharibacteria bacterium]